MLADHPLVQLVFHPDQLLRLGLGQLEHRNARPHRDDVGDLFLTDLGVVGFARRLPVLLEVTLLEGQLALGVTQRSSLLELLRLDRGLLLLAHRLDLVVEFLVHGRSGHQLDPHPRGGLVDQVDGLVRKLALLDVAVGQLGRGAQRLVGDGHAVVGLVAVAKPAQDLHGVLDRRLLHLDLLEAPLQGGVALEVLAVLVERGRADRLELTTGERGLEDRGRVDRALGRSRADQVVQLVDEQHDVAALADLLHDLLEPLLELSAILGAGHQGGQVEGVDLLALEQLGHLVGRDPLGQSFDHGGLAHTGLADQHRVVLGAARQDLHHALDLVLTADDRVELALGRELGQVAAELVEQLGALAALLAGGTGTRALTATGAGQHPDDFVSDLLGVGVEVEQDACRNPLVLADEPEQDVLGADVVVSQRQRLAQRQLQHLLGARSERDLTGGDLIALADDASDLRAHLFHGDVERVEDAGRKTLFLAEKAKKDVLSADVVVLERAGLVLCKHDDLTGTLGKAFKHVRAPCR